MNSRKKFTFFILGMLLLIVSACQTTPYDYNLAYTQNKHNFSQDFENATQYKLTASHLQLEAVNSYPQRIVSVESPESPYAITIESKQQLYSFVPDIPYQKYEYDTEISKYLEETVLISVNAQNVNLIAKSFVNANSSIQSIVSNALRWNKDNLSYSQEIADDIAYRNFESFSAEDTIVSKEASCVEFSQTFISFMRNLGIPARCVMGCYITPTDNQLVYHCWAEVYYLGHGWIPVETQSGKIGIPNNFIKLAVGSDYVNIGILVKQFQVNVKTVVAD